MAKINGIVTGMKQRFGAYPGVAAYAEKTLSELGAEISIATREAVLGDSYATLDAEVLHRFRADIETERTEHVESARLQLNAIRHIMQHLRPKANVDGGGLA